MLVWAWRKMDNAGPASQFYIKMVHHYKGVKPEQLFEALTTNVRTQWDEQDVFEIIDKDEANGAHVIH